MNAFFAIPFIIIAAGVAFALRGIWGHQIGGWIMGSETALAIGVVLDLEFASAVILAFFLSIAWAVASFVGWANHGPGQRFVRGCFAYGVLPGVMMAVVLFPGSPASWLVASAMVGLPTGIAFALYAPLLHYFETRWGKSSTASAWRDSMEYPAGVSHGVGIAVFLVLAEKAFVPAGGLGGGPWSWYHAILVAVAVGCAPLACSWKTLVHRRKIALSNTGENPSIDVKRVLPREPLVPVLVVITAGSLVLSAIMIALGSTSGLFCTHIVSVGVVGSLYDKHVTPEERIDVWVLWVGILASAVLAWPA